ncbi:hypothetical protein RMCBS344292_04588 [Rhizopus microsporus]|nr:hypothetical protein RMCBS344292_04588 [Rhizopus microsporus]
MIALVYFCIQQEKNILTLDEHDPTLHILYKAALKMFSVFKDSEINMTTKIHSFSKAVASRFEEIIKCSEEGSTLAKRRLQAYAEDGRLWAHSFKRRYLSENESISVTPIDAQGKSTPASADMKYVW